MSDDAAMVAPGFELVEALGAQSARRLTVNWGEASVTLPAPVDLGALRNDISGVPGLRVTGRFGEVGDVELELTSGSPDPTTLSVLQAKASTETMRLELLNPLDGWVAAEVAAPLLSAVVVTFAADNWCASIDRFEALAKSDWRSLVAWMTPGTVNVEGHHVVVEDLAAGGAASVLVPTSPRPERAGDEQTVWDHVQALADAQAWSLVATEVDEAGAEVLVALHRDQPAAITLTPGDAPGGVALWHWMTATSDANRTEAARHVLRLVTANAQRVPDGEAMVALAERHRIALARENAAEVQRAISDGRAATRAGLRDARAALSASTDDTIKTAQATMVAAIGIVALVARNEDALDWRLLVFIMAAASSAVAAVVVSRWRRMGDIGGDIAKLGESLSPTEEPLLPDADRAELRTSIEEFDATGRIRANRVAMTCFGAGAVLIIVFSGAWILTRPEGDQSETPVVAIDGFIRVEGAVTEFCEALGDDDPPSCDGDRWILRAVPATTIEALPLNAGSVRWTTSRTTVIGVVDDGVVDVLSLSASEPAG